MKRLVLDIETAPNTVYSWGLFNQNIAINQIKEPGYVLCWGAKWYGEDDLYFGSLQDGKKTMLKRVFKLMEQADAIITYNGTYFDIPTLNREFLSVGMVPPAPSANIDLLTTVRKQFKFPSNKLSYVANALGVGEKPSAFDMELWRRTMAGDKHAWDQMEEYNLNDVELTEAVYDILGPWIKNHPNHGLYGEGGDMVCPHCGSAHVTKRGLLRTKTLTYQRYQCQDCGAWSSARTYDRKARQNKLKGVM